jgi:hypothetical protein
MNNLESVLDCSIKHQKELEAEIKFLSLFLVISLVTFIILIVANFFFKDLFIPIIIVLFTKIILAARMIGLSLAITREKDIQEQIIAGNIPASDQEHSNAHGG